MLYGRLNIEKTKIMEEYNIDEVQNCYNLAAQDYLTQFANELDNKPFDRSVLIRFAQIAANKQGKFIDFATGDGHIADFLYKQGLTSIVGIDISEKLIEVARTAYPAITFEQGNMYNTGLSAESVDGIVSFYGIVHFTYKEIELTLQEWKRILRPHGKALFSFHIGVDDSIRVEAFLGNENAKATWNNFRVETVLAILDRNGIVYDEVVIRYPYINKEHPSTRCYIEFTKK